MKAFSVQDERGIETPAKVLTALEVRHGSIHIKGFRNIQTGAHHLCRTGRRHLSKFYPKTI